MLTYMSLDHDSQPIRAAKLKALQDYFKTPQATAFAMLLADSLASTNTKRGDTLVVNSHGNGKVFAGYDAAEFLKQLNSKGFAAGSFKSLYLMACKVGVQAQDNSILYNFAKDLKGLLNRNGIDIKVYAPRGLLSYSLKEVKKEGQTFYEVTKMYIGSPEREYTLDEGLLLVMP
jgi:hypothetical protein